MSETHVDEELTSFEKKLFWGIAITTYIFVIISIYVLGQVVAWLLF